MTSIDKRNNEYIDIGLRSDDEFQDHLGLESDNKDYIINN